MAQPPRPCARHLPISRVLPSGVAGTSPWPRLLHTSTGEPSSRLMAVGRCPSGASALGRWSGAARSARKSSVVISSSLSNISNPSSTNGPPEAHPWAKVRAPWRCASVVRSPYVLRHVSDAGTRASSLVYNRLRRGAGSDIHIPGTLGGGRHEVAQLCQGCLVVVMEHHRWLGWCGGA
jgi:hypothetical protein